MKKSSMIIQGILFGKDKWTKVKIRQWLKKHFENNHKIENTLSSPARSAYYEVRFINSKYFRPDSFRMKRIGRAILLRLGKLKKGYSLV